MDWCRGEDWDCQHAVEVLLRFSRGAEVVQRWCRGVGVGALEQRWCRCRGCAEVLVQRCWCRGTEVLRWWRSGRLVLQAEVQVQRWCRGGAEVQRCRWYDTGAEVEGGAVVD